jgi:hypothetical protein
MLTSSVQNQITYKNLFGKSQTNPNFDLVNEADVLFQTADSNYVWMDTISASASQSVNDGIAVQVTAVMSEIETSGKRSCYSLWPGVPPSGIDQKTGQSFAYGIGSLIGISAGTRLVSSIPDRYGIEYTPKPYVVSENDILPLDPRDWIFQPGPGIYYQDNPSDGVSNLLPNFIKVYYYLGKTLTQPSTTTNVRVSFTGTNSYTATQSQPTINSYSETHTYLADFSNANTSGTVSVNINSVGTYSVYKYGTSGLIGLNPGDISVSRAYFLKYKSDFSAFVLYENSPNSSVSKLINPSPTVEDFGGVSSGTSFDTNLSDVVNGLLYPEQSGFISNFGFVPSMSDYEVGDTMSFGNYVFEWSLGNTAGFGSNLMTIYDVSSYNPIETYWSYGGLVVTSLPNSLGTYSVSLGTFSSTTVRSRDFRISGKRNDGTTVSKNTSINWMYPFYLGTSTYSTLDSSGISSLTKQLSATSHGVWSIGGTYGYKYIAVPNDYSVSQVTYQGLPVVIADTGSYTFSTDTGIGYQMLTVTNSYGVGIDYSIFRTLNQLNGTFSVTIN